MSAHTRVNLHCHSNLSDGELSPEGLAAVLSEDGVRVAALTDHDTAEGTGSFCAAASKKGIGTISGIELHVMADDGHELHLLGYGFDPGNAELRAMLEQLRETNRAPAPGSIQESWMRPGGEDAPRQQPATMLPAREAIALLHAAGGIAVLAHPLSGQREITLEALDALLPTLKQQGLDGMEAIYNEYPVETRKRLIELADKHQLLVSAGSDFHALSHPGLGQPGIDMPTERWRKLRDAIFERRHALASGTLSNAAPLGKGSPPTSRSFILRIVLPTLVAIALFFIATYQVVIPSFERGLVDRKREMIRELTNVACGILAEYEQEVRDGKRSLEDAQAAAAERIRGLRYGSEQKDYFWLMDTHPRMIAHPYVPELDGHDLTDYKDQRGVRIFVEFVNVLKEHDDNYVEYI